MIKWTGTDEQGREVVGLGLEERNLQLLRAGRPIHVKGAQIGIPFDIFIHYAKSKHELTRDLIDAISRYDDNKKRPPRR